MQVDFPALERPTKANSGTLRAGKKCSSGAVVRNRAVCSQPQATRAAAAAGPGVALAALRAGALEWLVIQSRAGPRGAL